MNLTAIDAFVICFVSLMIAAVIAQAIKSRAGGDR